MKEKDWIAHSFNTWKKISELQEKSVVEAFCLHFFKAIYLIESILLLNQIKNRIEHYAKDSHSFDLLVQRSHQCFS